MFQVLGHWEIGYHAPITEQFYWALPLRDFGVDQWNMVPVSGVKGHTIPVKEWPDYETALESLAPLKRVFIEPRSRYNTETIWLHDYDHPADCLYIFGSAHYNPTIAHCRPGDDVVSIKTKNDAGVLWADQAACIVLYDRVNPCP